MLPVLTSADGAVLTLTLNRPERLNAVNTELYRGVLDGLDVAEADPAVRAVVLTGAGRAFCAGADVKEHAAGSRTPAERAEYVALGQRVCARIQTVPVPVVAAVHGYAIGAGAEMAVSADFLVMSTDARMSFPEVSIGTVAGGGVTHRLPRLVGLRRAADLLVLGERFSGTDAAAWGLAHATVEAGDLPESARTLAASLAAKAPLSFARLKAALREVTTLDQALDREAADLLAVMSTDDWAEGVAAFGARRSPVFQGR